MAEFEALDVMTKITHVRSALSVLSDESTDDTNRFRDAVFHIQNALKDGQPEAAAEDLGEFLKNLGQFPAESSKLVLPDHSDLENDEIRKLMDKLRDIADKVNSFCVTEVRKRSGLH